MMETGKLRLHPFIRGIRVTREPSSARPADPLGDRQMIEALNWRRKMREIADNPIPHDGKDDEL